MKHDVDPVPSPAKDDAHAFEDEGSMWHCGYELVLELRRLRGLSRELLPQPEEAERALNQFCHRLRRSDRKMSLPRLQREARLCNGHVAALVSVMATCWVGRIPSTVNQVAITAFGFSPIRLHAFVHTVHAKKGFGELVDVISGSLAPSAKLIALLSASLSVEDVMTFREELKRQSSADRKTIPDNNGLPDLEPE